MLACLLFAIACGGPSTAPTAGPTLLTLVVSGQSNAGYDPNPTYPLGWSGLGEALKPLATIRRAAQGAVPISVFGATMPPPPMDREYLWPTLSRLLTAPFDAFVWVHGESDAIDDALEPLYYDAAVDLFRRVRAAAGQPNLLIVIAGLPCYCTPGAIAQGDTARWNKMREVQQRLARDIPHTVFVNTLDLENGGGQHYSPSGYDVLAQRVLAAVRSAR